MKDEELRELGTGLVYMGSANSCYSQKKCHLPRELDSMIAFFFLVRISPEANQDSISPESTGWYQTCVGRTKLSGKALL